MENVQELFVLVEQIWMVSTTLPQLQASAKACPRHGRSIIHLEHLPEYP
jgi:hypothetical protein